MKFFWIHLVGLVLMGAGHALVAMPGMSAWAPLIQNTGETLAGLGIAGHFQPSILSEKEG